MKKIILNIAGILLQLDCEDRTSLTDSFRGFIHNHRKSSRKIWHLKSIGVDKRSSYRENTKIDKKILNIKKRFESIKGLNKDWSKDKQKLRSFNISNRYPLLNLSFYFGAPTFIDIKKKRITLFYLNKMKENYRKSFDSRFISYAYSQLLALNKGLLLHATAVIKNKKAYLFFGASGKGKSTVAQLCRRYKVLGDDIIAIRKNNTGYYAFSTPWKQKPFIKPDKYISARIEAVFFLKKSKMISFRPLREEDALIRVLSHHIHFFIYTESPLIEKIFFTSADFIKGIPSYEMEFRKDKSFWAKLEKVLGIR
ncbi:MAG: hypothetical protein ISS47_00995 [Candidatus Omnitrophica bacterium]|nr:hypothetical protein [Candidatus Omnitrophota bacterium]